jgi:phage recombination protein Bet
MKELTTTAPGMFTPEIIKDLSQAGIIPPNTPPAQIKIFAQICSEKNLSPFSKQIYLLGYNGTYSVITGIDGFRAIAARTGQYAGCEDTKFDLKPDGSYLTAAQVTTPITATTTVYRIIGGLKCAFTHTAVFKEFSSGKQKWQTMPIQMISKVAEAFAIRKGFGDVIGDIRIQEEAAAIENENTIVVTETKATKAATISEDEKLKRLTAAIMKASTIEDLEKLRPYIDETNLFICDAFNAKEKEIKEAANVQ